MSSVKLRKKHKKRSDCSRKETRKGVQDAKV